MSAAESPIDRAIREWPAICRRAARDAHRAEIRSFVDRYDPTFSRPRALFGSVHQGQSLDMSRERFLSLLRPAIRWQKQLRANGYAPATAELIGLRRVYVAERYAELRERAALRKARAA